MIPSYYEYYNPVKVVAGNKAVDNLPYELEQLGAKRPLVVTDQGVVGAGLMQIVADAFHGQEAVLAAVYEDTPPDSSVEVVNQVAKLYRKNKCDSIVGLGGGSAIDTAKAVNIVVTEDVDDLIKLMGAEVLKKELQPFIAIPTTAGTGSEVTLVAVVADTKRGIKMPFTSYHLLPKVAILDPRMTLTMPPKITAATGMDAMTHAVEAYTCIQKNPLSDAHATAAIALIRDNLLTAVEKGSNKAARFAMANASLLAGAAFSNAMVGVVHALAHGLGGVCHVPHGVANTIFLPFGMEFNLDKTGDLYGELLLPLAGEDVYFNTPKKDRPARAVEAVRDLNRRLNKACGLPITLKQAGVPLDKLEEAATAVLNDGAVTYNPKAVSYEDALSIVKAAYDWL
ncbi:alcohol dehydrogenase [Desulfatibacillum alkenivorans DSM 16219]|jgi:alcohol dehydrogenase|uniref:Alcohol dehydrogenase n=1 Tax=Desulfatibacillum alkenivorans DSM 16219 TaxID=1121393 RepID=A0A1M6RJ39_9BACT|nr:iron-containing alcohol dehydrogenase [Desulfatibacillum alkenivorans]SHK32388.1 alcohol dehydrogenase [Desulfatibacillum alkenivorans DSM 16219]